MNHLLTQLAVRLVENAAKKPKKGTEGLVYQSPVLLWVGIIGSVFFLIPGLLVPLHNGEWLSGIFFLGFSAMSFSLVIAYINCRIYYTESEFTAKNFLGFRRTFTYNQVESIRGNIRRDVKLKVAGRTVNLDELSVGKVEFLDMVHKQYRLTHGGKALPETIKDRWDPFQGHVDNPGEMVFSYLLVAVILPAVLLFSFFATKATPMEELTIVSGTVTHYEVDSSNLILRVKGVDTEVWGYRRSLTDPDAFLRSCANDPYLTLGYRTVTDEGQITGYCTEYIEDQWGTVWITPQDARNERIFTAAMALGFFELFWLAYCGASIYVGRNPHKFSKRVLRQFFREGYVH